MALARGQTLSSSEGPWEEEENGKKTTRVKSTPSRPEGRRKIRGAVSSISRASALSLYLMLNRMECTTMTVRATPSVTHRETYMLQIQGADSKHSQLQLLALQLRRSLEEIGLEGRDTVKGQSLANTCSSHPSSTSTPESRLTWYAPPSPPTHHSPAAPHPRSYTHP